MLINMTEGAQLNHAWAHATMQCGSGWQAADFLTVLQAYVEANARYKTPDGDGRYLFPTDM
eukprot:4247406-Heterocapsa_arctica.AAC.1